jgi:hypothetical protein
MGVITVADGAGWPERLAEACNLAGPGDTLMVSSRARVDLARRALDRIGRVDVGIVTVDASAAHKEAQKVDGLRLAVETLRKWAQESGDQGDELVLNDATDGLAQIADRLEEEGHRERLLR